MRYLLGLILVASMPVISAWAGETKIDNNPVTVFGPTGLIFTQSADTLEPGKAVTGISFTHERSVDPDISSQNELAGTITLGLKRKIEVSAQIPFLINQKGFVSSDDKNNLEDINLSVKWRFFEQYEKYNVPAFGLSLTYYFPTAKEAFQAVDTWGVKVLLVSSAYTDIAQPLGSYIVGFYADGGLFIADIGKSVEEKHGLLDLGIGLPLDESRKLNLIIEGNLTVQNDIPFEKDFFGATAGLRYITDTFNLTAGLQRRIKRDEGFEDTNSLVIQASYIF